MVFSPPPRITNQYVEENLEHRRAYFKKPAENKNHHVDGYNTLHIRSSEFFWDDFIHFIFQSSGALISHDELLNPVGV